MLDEYNAKIKTTLNQEEEELKRKINYYLKCKDEYFRIRNDLVITMTWKELLEAGLRHEAMSNYHIHNKVTLMEAKRFIENYEK